MSHLARPLPLPVSWLTAVLVALLSTAPAVAVEVRAAERAAAASAAVPAAKRVPAKTAATSGELLLPHFVVEAGNPNGVTTLLSVRNESEDDTVGLTLRYYETDRPQVALDVETLELAPKQMLSANLRDRVRDLDLPVDPDGFARGYVEISADAATIHGDTYQVDTAEAFASGNRLLDVDPASAHNDLCSRVAARFLNGGGFSSSSFKVWLDAAAPPDPATPVLFYTVYDEAGAVHFFGQLHETRVSFEVDLEVLFGVPGVSFPNFGTIDFEFNGTVGHVVSVLSAGGQYSVAVDGVCQDVAAP